MENNTSCQTVTIEEIMEILPYCIPNQWRTQMALLPKDMWDIPPNIEKVLLKIYDTDFPWEKPPFKGMRRMWIRDISHTKVTEEKNE